MAFGGKVHIVFNGTGENQGTIDAMVGGGIPGFDLSDSDINDLATALIPFVEGVWSDSGVTVGTLTSLDEQRNITIT